MCTGLIGHFLSYDWCYGSPGTLCTGLIGHCLSYDWCYGSPGTLCTRLIGHCFLIFDATGRLALRVYGADWALFIL